MDSVDIEVLKSALDWLEEGRRVTLATVVQTYGSSPRPPGALLAIRGDGRVCGSVSGGCVEDDLIEQIRRGTLATEHPEVVTYGITREQAQRFGLPCGGTLKIVLEPLRDLEALRALLAAIERRELIARTLDLETGAFRLAPAGQDDELGFDGHLLTTVHGPRWRLIIVGAGQASQYLAQMAQALDYQVFVCDPREEYAAGWSVPGVQLETGMPDDMVSALGLDARSAVVALTHDPKLDDMVLLEALSSPAFYVGALGSRANNAKRRQRLAQHFGFTEAELARLHGPVGLRIGSRTPPEIAIAILAELIALRHGLRLESVAEEPTPAPIASVYN